MTSIMRKIVAGGLATLTTAAAQNTGMAVVVGSGGIYLNGAQLSNSNAIVAGDVVQTKENGSAMISASGSSVALDSNTIMRFQGASVALDRGAVKVATGQQMTVNARDLKIVPTSQQWTQFYVTRSSGMITMIALKKDIAVSCGGSSVTVKEGHQLSRYDGDNCGLARKGDGMPPAATGPVLSSARATEAALAVGGALAVWALWHCDDPVSPDSPRFGQSELPLTSAIMAWPSPPAVHASRANVMCKRSGKSLKEEQQAKRESSKSSHYKSFKETLCATSRFFEKWKGDVPMLSMSTIGEGTAFSRAKRDRTVTGL